MKMNIKKRLAVSNLLMLLIPVAVVLVTGLIFLVIIFSLLNSNGFRFAEEHFYDNKDEIVQMIGKCLTDDDPTEELDALIRSAGQSELRIVIAENGEIVYEAGIGDASDEELLSMAAGDEEIFVANEFRQLYKTVLVQGDRTFQISVFCNYSAALERALERALAFMVVSLIVLVAISIILANRLLSLSVFRKIEAPLDKLLSGAREADCRDHA